VTPKNPVQRIFCEKNGTKVNEMAICKQQIPAGHQSIAGFLFLFFLKYSSL
jgi:hypothetical protein